MGGRLLPALFDFIPLLLGTPYVFAFPFCPNCAPEHFKLWPVRLDSSSLCSPMHPSDFWTHFLRCLPTSKQRRTFRGFNGSLA